MDYEKKYNNALDRARLAIKDCGDNQGRKEMLYGIFPELKGSEDENIRRGLMALISNWNYPQELFAPITKILAWLEKQKENPKSAECVPDSVKFDEGFKTGREIGFREGAESVKPVEWSDDFEENIRILLHDKLTWHSGDGAMSTAVLIDDKQLKDIISGIWFYVGKEVLKYPNKELNVSEWSEEDTLMLTAIIQTLERFGGRGTTEMQIDWLKSLRPQPK